MNMYRVCHVNLFAEENNAQHTRTLPSCISRVTHIRLFDTLLGEGVHQHFLGHGRVRIYSHVERHRRRKGAAGGNKFLRIGRGQLERDVPALGVHLAVKLELHLAAQHLLTDRAFPLSDNIREKQLIKTILLYGKCARFTYCLYVCIFMCLLRPPLVQNL